LGHQAYASARHHLPSPSTDHSNPRKKIPERQIRPGEVIFFATGKKKKEVTHTGIVTEAQKNKVRFIHASTSKGVTEDYLSNTYWTKAYLFARRLDLK
jgi:cell wall-associated NlpC family hydrolase